MSIERKELIHKHPGYSDEDFFSDIDKTGGWPVGYSYVSFFHAICSDNRYCVFGNKYMRTDFWTTVCSSDDYYWWKLSDDKKKEVVKIAREELMTKLSRLA